MACPSRSALDLTTRTMYWTDRGDQAAVDRIFRVVLSRLWKS